jgi:rare lipoprotein A (peptidoglycan hydrolase)
VPFLLSAGLAAAPFLCLRSGPGPVGLAVPAVAGPADADTASRPLAARAARGGARSRHVETTVALASAPGDPTTTTSAPPTTPVTTPSAPRRPATTAPRLHVESAARPAPVTSPAPRARARSVAGKATWYRAADGTCAANVAPMGALLSVTSRATGATVTCRVVSRGPYGAGRVVDLARTTFARLAPPSVGVIDVVISW